jgi:hypothetical protein
MNEKHCVSLELSKRLKEVGYKQEGGFAYVKSGNPEWLPTGTWGLIEFSEVDRRNWEFFVAPLASEIMERLPFIVGIYLRDNRVSVDIGMLTYIVTGKSGNPYNPIGFEDDTICNNLAKMYIYLAEHNLL